MPRTEAVVLALVALQESGNAALLTQRAELLVAAGNQLVHVSLVAHVPNKFVVRSIKNVMQGERKLDNAQAGRQMSAVLSNLTNNRLADLLGKLLQFFDGTLPDIRRRLYVFQIFHFTRVMMNAAMARKREVSQSRASRAAMDSS